MKFDLKYHMAAACLSVTIGSLCTRVVPKLMPPIYFHGNYTRYKEHNNTI